MSYSICPYCSEKITLNESCLIVEQTFEKNDLTKKEFKKSIWDFINPYESQEDKGIFYYYNLEMPDKTVTNLYYNFESQLDKYLDVESITVKIYRILKLV